MSHIRKLFFTVAFSLGLTGISEATPWGMKRDADIKTIEGSLSICIPDDEDKTIAIDSLIISQSFLENGERITAWNIEKTDKADPKTLHPGECLKYGELIDGYRELVPKRELKPGTVYQARINRLVTNPNRTDILFYTAAFCSVERKGGIIYTPYKPEKIETPLRPGECRHETTEKITPSKP